MSGIKQNPVIKLKINEDVVLQSVEEFDSRSDLAQVSIGHSDSTAEKVLDYSSFPVREDVCSHFSSFESTVEKI